MFTNALFLYVTVALYFVFNMIDILMLYRESYQEPVHEVQQTFPPTIPIEKLYSDSEYPVGQELPYTVRFPVSIWVHKSM